jgi:hypothetical protein
VEEATASHISNGDNPESDWSQGYGYQFWRARHGAYRGDGAFGQYCVVMPEQDAVLAITAGVGDMQSVLNLIWQRLLPAMGPTSLSENAGALRALQSALAALALQAPAGERYTPTASAVTRKTYRLDPIDSNAPRWSTITFEFGEQTSEMRIENERGEHRIAIGSDGIWTEGETQLDRPGNTPIAASGAWIAADTYQAKLAYCETPFVETFTACFTGDQVVLDRRINVAFGPTERPQLKGHAD